MGIPKTNSVSLISGIKFIFHEGGNEIGVVGSALSGKELVYVNGKIVSEKRSMNKSSTHQFRIDKDEYEIHFNVPEIMKGKVECSLTANGIVKKRYRTSQSRKFASSTFYIFVLIGAVFGFLLYAQKLPLWTIAPFILLAFISGAVIKMNRIHIEEF